MYGVFSSSALAEIVSELREPDRVGVERRAQILLNIKSYWMPPQVDGMLVAPGPSVGSPYES